MSLKKPKSWLPLAVFVASPPSLAFIEADADFVKSFDPQAALSADGRSIVLTGAIGPCIARERTSEVQAQITQETILASANGRDRRPCSTTEPVVFSINVTVDEGQPAFVLGPAKACGTAISRAQGQIVDVETWCTFVNLMESADNPAVPVE
jgi:hypothetical protein